MARQASWTRILATSFLLASLAGVSAVAPTTGAVPDGPCSYTVVVDPTCTATFDPAVSSVIVSATDDNFDQVHLRVCVNGSETCVEGCGSLEVVAEMIYRVDVTVSTHVDGGALDTCAASEGIITIVGS